MSNLKRPQADYIKIIGLQRFRSLLASLDQGYLRKSCFSLVNRDWFWKTYTLYVYPSTQKNQLDSYQVASEPISFIDSLIAHHNRSDIYIGLNCLVDFYIDYCLYAWKGKSTSEIVEKLKPIVPLLQLVKQSKPSNRCLLVVGSEHEIAYRGNVLDPNLLESFFSQTNPKDWKVASGDSFGEAYMLYSARLFDYKPHREIQSWTVSKTVVDQFVGNALLIADVPNNSFFFDPLYFELSDLGVYLHEKEILHFGRDMKVKLAIPIKLWKALNARLTT